MSNNKGKEAWQIFKTGVPDLKSSFYPELKPVTDSSVLFQHLKNQLPAELSSNLVSEESINDKLAKASKPAFYLCDMAEGQFPRTYRYEEIVDLAGAIRRMEGRETALVAFYGIQLPFSKLMVTNEGARYRCLMLPNGLVALTGENFKIVAQTSLTDNLELEEQGWVGDPDFMDPTSYYHDNFDQEDMPDIPDDDDDLPGESSGDSFFDNI
jgi:hypothetical protein